MHIAEVDPLTLPSLPLGERSHLPDCPAIYFVMQGEHVLYIGKTINLVQRWVDHHKWNQLITLGTPVKIAWLECSDKNLLTQIETALIRQFAPELNGYVTDKKKDANYGLSRGLVPSPINANKCTKLCDQKTRPINPLKIRLMGNLQKKRTI